MRRVRPPFSTVAIVGVGLIGGSVALATRRRWPEVRLIGIDADARRGGARSTRAALVDEFSTRLDRIGGADLVVLAAPVAANVGLMARVARHLRDGAIVTDVGSTKRDIVAAARTAGVETFVAGHPVAGSEKSGPDQARADLFDRAPWVLTPDDASSAAVRKVMRFARALGGSVYVLSSVAHDELFARISHLPQVVSTVLMRTVHELVAVDDMALCGGGLRDTTRLAGSNAALWVDILHMNRANVRAALLVFERELATLRRALDDRARLEALLRSGGDARATLVRVLGRR